MNKRETKLYEMILRMQPKLFDVDNVTREELLVLFEQFRMPPGASGSTGPCRIICGLLQQIATLKGFEPLEWACYAKVPVANEFPKFYKLPITLT